MSAIRGQSVRSTLLLVVAGLLIATGSPAAAQTPAVDLPAALAQLSPRTMPLEFSRGEVRLPAGGHLQGMQMVFDPRGQRHLAYLSHDSLSVAYLLVVEFPAELSGPGRVIHLQELPSDGQSPPLRHAGGIQLAGDVLAVGVEDNQAKTRSQIQFWNVAEPTQPRQLKNLTIERRGEPKDQTAGAVGLARHAGGWLLAVANWDSRAVDFYRANRDELADPHCRFELLARWPDAAAEKADWQPDRTFGSYQAINLFAGANEDLSLLGLYTTPSGDNLVDLFAVDLKPKQSSTPLRLRKLTSKPFQLSPGNRFQYAGGIWLERGRLGVLASPRAVGPRTLLDLAHESSFPDGRND